MTEESSLLCPANEKLVKEGYYRNLPLRNNSKNAHPIPRLLLDLLTRCWDPNPNKRPEFKDIVSRITAVIEQNNPDYMKDSLLQSSRNIPPSRATAPNQGDLRGRRHSSGINRSDPSLLKPVFIPVRVKETGEQIKFPVLAGWNVENTVQKLKEYG
jgi:hypothetical protein